MRDLKDKVLEILLFLFTGRYPSLGEPDDPTLFEVRSTKKILIHYTDRQGQRRVSKVSRYVKTTDSDFIELAKWTAAELTNPVPERERRRQEMQRQLNKEK